MTKDDKVFRIMTRLIFKVTIEKTAKFRQKLSSRPMFQSLPKLCEHVNSRLNYGNLDFNFNVEAEKTLLNLDQMYLNVHYRLGEYVNRF